MLHIPNIQNSTACDLAKAFKESELCITIAYIDCVLNGILEPRPQELTNLGIFPLEYTREELQATQRRLALAVCKQRGMLRKAA